MSGRAESCLGCPIPESGESDGGEVYGRLSPYTGSMGVKKDRLMFTPPTLLGVQTVK